LLNFQPCGLISDTAIVPTMHGKLLATKQYVHMLNTGLTGSVPSRNTVTKYREIFTNLSIHCIGSDKQQDMFHFATFRLSVSRSASRTLAVQTIAVTHCTLCTLYCVYTKKENVLNHRMLRPVRKIFLRFFAVFSILKSTVKLRNVLCKCKLLYKFHTTT
jgi:hypothetical protein